MRLIATSYESRFPLPLVSALFLMVLAAGGCRAPAPEAGEAAGASQAPPAQASAEVAADAPAVPVDNATAPPADAGMQLPAAETDDADAVPINLRVVGTEPFWGIRIEGDRLHFTTMEDQAGRHLTASPTPRPDGVAYIGTDDGQAFELMLTRATCSDGMSERSYAYTATFAHAGMEYRGCADDAAKF